MNTTIRLLALVALVITGSSCNRRDSPFDGPTTPTPSAGLSDAQRPSVYSIGFQPPATYGPATVRGTVALTFGAPAGGLEVSLSSGDPTLLSLPSTVMIPAGKDSTEFSATVPQQVSTDRDVTVTATTAVGRSTTTNFSLWAILPTFFSFTSEAGDYIGGGDVRRLLPPYKTFTASCSGNQVQFGFWDDAGRSWQAHFQAPKGVPLRVGTYEGATRSSFQRDTDPGLDIYGEGRGCNTLTGRFTVREADFSPSGQVRQFWATFEQHCENMAPALRGDVRVTNGPAVSGGNCLQ